MRSTILFLITLLSAAYGLPAQAQNFKATYRCSLLIQSSSGRHLVDIRDKRVTALNKDLIEVFEGLDKVIREATVSNSEILMKTNWVRLGQDVVPEMSIGVYRYNKLSEDARAVVVEGRGDARSFVKLTGHAPNGSRIDVSCRNESLESI